jgi:hypothetical protein
MAYAMADLGWKFYFINAAWNFVFLIIAYFTFVETKGLKLEEINAKFEDRELTEGISTDSNSQDDLEVSKMGGVVAQKSITPP